MGGMGDVRLSEGGGEGYPLKLRGGWTYEAGWLCKSSGPNTDVAQTAISDPEKHTEKHLHTDKRDTPRHTRTDIYWHAQWSQHRNARTHRQMRHTTTHTNRYIYIYRHAQQSQYRNMYTHTHTHSSDDRCRTLWRQKWWVKSVPSWWHHSAMAVTQTQYITSHLHCRSAYQNIDKTNRK